ncbi:phosphoglycerate mutase [Lojkania enalia]|uniref:Phosphoglycerate mutase n=1 Tax=Lojkania enalia TaxID=147567 RepID=A0A9P4MU99_9PLEO|nr:phosphoglycerate mutase [Didymosphaeria enalia]
MLFRVSANDNKHIINTNDLHVVTRTIYCIRHGQGLHNILPANHDLQDPLLTLFGEQQCHDIAATIPFHDQIELVVTSPPRRTIRTALLGFAPEVTRGVQVLALPLLQEASTLPCDTGSELGIIKEEFKDSAVDFSLVQEGWHLKQDTSLIKSAALLDRADATRRWLQSRPEKNIVVVSHGCFLHFLTDDWSSTINAQGTGWANAEFRSYELCDSPDNPLLLETSESKLRRGLSLCVQTAE